MHKSTKVKPIKRRGRKFFVLRWKDHNGQWREETTDIEAVESKRRQADRLAVKKEESLRGLLSGDMLWSAFIALYQVEHMAQQSKHYQTQFNCAKNRLQESMDPSRLSEVNSTMLSTFAARMRARKKPLKEASISSYLKALHAALQWAEHKDLISKTPRVNLAAGASGMRSRPITAEELDRYMMAARKVRPEDHKRWRRAIRWLYLSGLRISEAVALSWDSCELFSVHLTDDRPHFVISAMGQKSRKDEICPMAPDFAEALRKVPVAARHGRVFRLPFSVKWVTRILGRIGKRSRIKVNSDGKTVSAHDLRRSFCTRWSLLVKEPIILQKLARHSSIETTLKYYVLHDAKTMHDKLLDAMGDKSGDIPKKQESTRVFKDHVNRDGNTA